MVIKLRELEILVRAFVFCRYWGMVAVSYKTRKLWILLALIQSLQSCVLDYMLQKFLKTFIFY